MLKASYRLKLTENLYQNELIRTDDLRYSIYHEAIGQYENAVCPLHWHQEMELCVVTKGSLTVKLGYYELPLAQGEGAFINANVLHSYQERGEGSTFLSIVFSPAFVAGGSGQNSIYQKYLRPILQEPSARCIYLTGSVEWQKEVLQKCMEIYRLGKLEAFGHELMVRRYLSDIVLAIRQHAASPLSAGSVSPQACLQEEDAAVRQMVRFIREHYAQKLTVADIAGAASISSRECFRRFQKYAKTSPLHYLETVRFVRASELLLESDARIQEICDQCGFGKTSYFCRRFKEYFQMTPLQYRKKVRAEAVAHPFRRKRLYEGWQEEAPAE